MLLLAMALALPFGAQAQGNYVYVNNQTAANSVSAYSASATGALSEIPGSPFATGGGGANVVCYGLERITVSGVNNFMFVANTGNMTISAFQIAPATGALTLVPGSPFASGLTLDGCQGMSIATTPDGLFLMASSNGQINTFSIAATGALAPFASTPNCCTPMAGMIISPDGRFLAVSNQNSVSMFTILAGALTPVPGSPFPKTGTGSISGLDFSCAADRLYGGEATGSPTSADAWTVDASGILTPVPGSPFHTAGNNSNVVLLSPDNSLLFESNQFSNSVNSFNVLANGALSNSGKFGGTGTVHTPVGMATDAAGRFLYVADDNFGVAAYRINAGGSLTSLADLGINRPGEIQDLAAYPPRSCASADLTITKTAAPTVVAGSPIVYNITVTNNGPSAASAVVSDTLPAGTTPSGNLKIVAATGAQRAGGVVTIHTTVPHQIFAGERVVIGGVGDPSFNGVFNAASVPDGSTFTYIQAGPDVTSGSGTATTPNCQVPPGGTGVCGTPIPARLIPIVAATGANRSGGVVTITTTAPHLLLAGQTISISGVANTSFNGTFPNISVPAPTTITYNQAGVNAASGGGNITTGQTLTAVFSTLANGETQTVLLTTTTGATAANGTVIGNTATISNKSAVDANPADNTASAVVTVGTPAATMLTVPDGTGPYGGLATLSAVLKNKTTNAPISGKTLTFQLNGNLASAVTDATGTATVTSLPIGTISVGTHLSAFTVSFGGDSSFQASSAVGTLVVTKARLTVAADNQSRLYGDPNPPLTYTITGFVNGDTIAVVSGTADCTTTATPASPVGTYPITCTVGTLTATNYDFVFVDGALTVNPAPLTVTVANALRAYGDPNPAFTGVITGLKNGDVITATYSTTATITSPVGTYPITATLVDPGNVLGNYAVTINNGTLTITPAALVVTANNAARLYGDPNPPFSGSIAGIKNGDNITAIYTTPATPASPIGTYPIIPTLTDNGTGALANYTITANNGSLTVSPAPLTVTAADATRAFGAPNPVFTGTITGIKNGDNITATYSTPATATSPAGTYPIIPTLVDPSLKLGNYTVTINNGTLTITAAVLTVTANNASRLYGDPNPVFTGTITGIVNGDNITATYASAATPASPIGTYAIVPTPSDNGTGALANYIVVINNGILTVNPAPLSVTAANATSVYGDPIPVLTGVIVGIKNGDNITATFATTATPASPVGTYPIVPTLIDPALKLGNYTVTSINGTLTITAAPLTVTAGNASRLFGTPNPPLSGIIAGIKNGDNITATYSTTAVATSPVGTYPITPTLVDPGGMLGNYAVISNNGTLTVNAAPTGNFVFVNNQAAAGNSISGYSVAADGTLTALAGSPVATGGLGGNVACSSVDRIALSAGNNLLFVSNSGDQSISAFSIDPPSGALTAVAGSPFASGLTLDACGGISLAASPDGAFLMASSNGQIKTFGIGAGGALSALSTAANPVLPNASMKISANGQFLAVSNGVSVSLYTINGDGSLAPVAGSPFAETGTGTLAGLDFSSTSGLLFGAEASATAGLADTWTVAVNGVLSAVAGSPFNSTGVNSSAVLLSPDNSLLFASNQGSSNINSFSVSAAGSLAGIGSFGSLHAPVGMATDRSGSLLYVADDTFGVAVFNIGGAGALSQLSDVAIAGAGQVQSLVAYPPRMASTADVSVTAAAGSPNVVAGQNVTYTLTVTNNGADPASVTVTDTLPSGFTLVSCAATGNGVCAGSAPVANFFLLQSGETQTVTLVASTSLSIPDGTVTTNTASISNNSAVDPNAANNSATVTVTVAQPTVTALTVAPASAAYGDSTATLSATLKDSLGAAVPGKTISFTFNAAPAGSAVTDANGIASVSVSLAGINAGTYAVSASFAGDANTQAASGSSNLVVNPAVLTITAGSASRLYGDPNPTFTFAFSGFVNGETAAVLTGSPSCSTAADPTSAVGTYPIICSAGTLSAANYTFTFVSGTLTITPAPLSVTAADATRVYGDPNPAFTGALTGIKNGDNITATYSTSATAASAVGTYPITPALVDPAGKLGNYTVASTNGTLTITPAPLSVTAANASQFYGDPTPALTGTITGIKNGDNITATYSTTATSASAPGAYPIVPALVDPTAKLSNYTVTVTNGTLTVNPAPLTVTAADASRLYGDPNPAFTGTISGIKNGDTFSVAFSSIADATSPVGTYSIVPTLTDPNNKLPNYAVTINNGTLTVTPAQLTAAATNASRLYGDANPAFTGTITGLKNGDNITATFVSAADPTSPVGTYPITPSFVDPGSKLGNYSVTTSGALTVNPAPLTVTADSFVRLYGDANPVFTGAITGVKNGDNITAAFGTVADPTSPVGAYPIVPVLIDPTGKLGNYTVTSNNGALLINPAPLSVTAADASRVYGDANPVFSGTITGIKNSDNITATYASIADPTSAVGLYPIIPSLVDPAGKLGNYVVTSISGTLTITPAPLTVQANDATRAVGAPDPVFTGTITGIKNSDSITATYSTTATATDPAGTYPITPTLIDPALQLGNYAVTSIDGTLTITP